MSRRAALALLILVALVLGALAFFVGQVKVEGVEQGSQGGE